MPLSVFCRVVPCGAPRTVRACGRRESGCVAQRSRNAVASDFAHSTSFLLMSRCIAGFALAHAYSPGRAGSSYLIRILCVHCGRRDALDFDRGDAPPFAVVHTAQVSA